MSQSNVNLTSTGFSAVRPERKDLPEHYVTHDTKLLCARSTSSARISVMTGLHDPTGY